MRTKCKVYRHLGASTVRCGDGELIGLDKFTPSVLRDIHSFQTTWLVHDAYPKRIKIS